MEKKMDIVIENLNKSYGEKKVLTDDEYLTLIYEYCFLLRENNSALLVKLMK